ncbi:MAG: ATP-binding cassette domain-containing protein [Erysipelotrichaceae bacterium]|jgi:putative ABC transport system ATP-binding protein|nr:ATP-binding cassette domain-containing protein [Erysipelotrichaceae bacterium]
MRLLLNNLLVSYYHGQHLVLNRLSYEFQDKRLYGIIGASGSGKSTILNLIMLLEKPQQGEIFLDNVNIIAFDTNKRSKYLTNDVGIVFQHFNLVSSLSILENLVINNQTSHQAEIDTLLLEYGFKDLESKNISVLSNGEKQRLCFIRAILKRPRILLCDEPTGSLDHDNSLKIMQFIKAYSQKHLVILVSHNVELVRRFADVVLELKDGKLHEA